MPLSLRKQLDLCDQCVEETGMLRALLQRGTWSDESCKPMATRICNEMEAIFIDIIGKLSAAQPEGSTITTEERAAEAGESLWKKYGSRKVGRSHVRDYYRCSDTGCPARKTVQKRKNCVDSSKFKVTYRSNHTCNINMDDVNVNKEAHQDPSLHHQVMLTGEQDDCSNICSSTSESPIRSDATSSKRPKHDEYG